MILFWSSPTLSVTFPAGNLKSLNIADLRITLNSILLARFSPVLYVVPYFLTTAHAVFYLSVLKPCQIQHVQNEIDFLLPESYCFPTSSVFINLATIFLITQDKNLRVILYSETRVQYFLSFNLFLYKIFHTDCFSYIPTAAFLAWPLLMGTFICFCF